METVLPEVHVNRRTGVWTTKNVRIKICAETGRISLKTPRDESTDYNIKQFVKKKLPACGKMVTLVFDTKLPGYSELAGKPISLKLVAGEDSALLENIRNVLTTVMEKFSENAPRPKTPKVIDLDRDSVKSCSYISSSNISSQKRPSSYDSNKSNKTTPTAPIINKMNTSRTGLSGSILSTIDELYPSKPSTQSDSKPMDAMKSMTTPFKNVTRSVLNSQENEPKKSTFYNMPDLDTASSIYDRPATRTEDNSKQRPNLSNLLYTTPVKRNDDSDLSAPSSRPSKAPLSMFGDLDKLTVETSPEEKPTPSYRQLPSRPTSLEPMSPPENKELCHRKLVNIGNSCYMNSTFQAISCLEPFMAKLKQVFQFLFMVNSIDTEDIAKSGAKHRIDFLRLFTEVLHTLSRSICVNRPLYTNKNFPPPLDREKLERIRRLFGQIKSDFDNSDQQDAHEFWILLIDEVDQLIYSIAKRHWKMGRTYIPDKALMKEKFKKHSDLWKLHPMRLLEIVTENRALCEGCGKEKIIDESLAYDLLVNVKKNYTLQQLVADVFPCSRTEATCECGFKSMLMSSRIKVFPEILVINLKRYKVVNNVEMKKCDIFVPIDPIIYTPDLKVFQNEVHEESDCEEEQDVLFLPDVPSSTPEEPIKENKIEEINTKKDEDKEAGDELGKEMERDENNEREADYSTPKKKNDSGIGRRSSGRKAHFDIFSVKKDQNKNANEEGTMEEMKLLGGADGNANEEEKEKEKEGEEAEKEEEEEEKKAEGEKHKEPPLKKRKESDDVEIIEEKVVDSIPFIPLIDIDDVKSLLRLCEVSVNSDTLRDHLDSFPTPVVDEIKVEAKPWKTHVVDADGNCFYRAISWWLTGTERHHKVFRNLNVDFMRRNGEMMEAITGHSVEELIKASKKDCEWSNETEIIAMCSFLKIDIYTFFNGKWVRYQPRPKPGSGPVVKKLKGAIYLTNPKSVHFDVVTACGSTVPSPSPRKTRKRKSPTPKDSDTDDDDMPERKSSKSGKKTEEVRSTREKLPRQCNMSKNQEKDQNDEEANKNKEKIDYKKAGDAPIYRLMSVVCHQGSSPHRGHYVAYTRNTVKGDWVYCSDDYVSSATESRVLKQTGETGYLLFYTRVHHHQSNGNYH